MKKARSFLAVAAAGLALLSAGWTSVYAAAPPATGQGNGLKISPVRTDLTIEKGGTRQVSLYLENITAFPITIHGVANDFVASDDESGEPRIILDPNQSAPDHSFKTLVGALATTTIQPNERKEIKVTLTVPQSAASGGYYGAIRFLPGTDDNSKNVSLTASVGSIFLITVPGQLTEALKVASFDAVHNNDVGSLFNSGPISVQTRFQNYGNIHVSPFGKIYLKDYRGKVLESIEINDTDPRGTVLPNSIRKFMTPLKTTHFFGRYTIEGNFGYGENGDLIMAKKTFYIIPFKLIATVIFILAFLIFVLPRLIRLYNQSIIRRSQGAASRPARAQKPKAKPRTKPKK